MTNQPLNLGMHVLHISTAKTWRGGEQQLAYLVQELTQKGVQQTAFCVKDAPFHAFCQKNGIPHIVFTKKNALNIRAALHLKRLCSEKKIDLVHLHDAHAHTMAYLAAVLWRNPTPLVLSRRVDFPIKKNWFSYKKYNHPRIRKILCVSDAIRQITAPDITDQRKLDVVHSGIDPQRFRYKNTHILRKTYHIAPDTPLVGNMAAIAPHKDYFTFVKTAKQIIQKGIKAHFFIIGGDGGEATALRHFIAQENMETHLTLTGFRKDIPLIMPELDVFLITSKTEGLGTSILDAFACNVPVVATQTGGIPEAVIHEQTGLLAPVGDATTLARHVIRLLQHASLATTFRQNALRHLHLHFTKQRTAEKTFYFYEEVVGKKQNY